MSWGRRKPVGTFLVESVDGCIYTVHTRDMTTKIACPKCSGSGIVARFLDYEGGVCFDCGGTGSIVALVAPSAVKARLRRDAARRVGQAVAEGTDVPADVRADALAYFENLGPASWREADYHARNALVLAGS